MAERKVLTKYYPPDFDPAALEKRVKGPGKAGPKVQTVRLMAPFSMKCMSCGEYIYKGRKFNARKETTEEKYYAISIFRFYIRCTRCSAEITFKTDPKNMDYTCERGARRNFEVWREDKLSEETEEERLDRLEKEEAERDAMKELEAKTLDAKTEMQIADALDEIRTRNARNERAGNGLAAEALVTDSIDLERQRLDQEDAEAARLAFLAATGEKVKRLVEDDDFEETTTNEPPTTALGDTATNKITKLPPNADSSVPVPTFQRAIKKKKDFGAALGIKRKIGLV